MRFLGEIASLDFGASPIKTIESFWDGDLPVPFFFSLVLVLQLPQQRPGANYSEDDSHENAKGDINRGQKRVVKRIPSICLCFDRNTLNMCIRYIIF